MVGTKFHALHILQFLPADLKTKLGHGGGQGFGTIVLSCRVDGGITTKGMVEVASILVMSLAQYRAKYGELPDSEYLSMVKAGEITPELARNLAGGMEISAGVLGTLAMQNGEDVEIH